MRSLLLFSEVSDTLFDALQTAALCCVLTLVHGVEEAEAPSGCVLMPESEELLITQVLNRLLTLRFPSLMEG